MVEDARNWLSGIPFIDRIFFGPEELLPDFYKNNKGRCTHFLLFQFYWVCLVSYISLSESLGVPGGCLFILIGLAIVIYLNLDPL